jgi:hypothetical protein
VPPNLPSGMPGVMVWFKAAMAWSYHSSPSSAEILNLWSLALTSPTGGGRSVGIVRSRTKATEFSLPTFLWIYGVVFGKEKVQLYRTQCGNEELPTAWASCRKGVLGLEVWFLTFRTHSISWGQWWVFFRSLRFVLGTHFMVGWVVTKTIPAGEGNRRNDRCLSFAWNLWRSNLVNWTTITAFTSFQIRTPIWS